MKELTLKRISSDSDGTYGVILDGTKPFVVTLERPWMNNEKKLSCVPPGSYLCRRRQSPKFGVTFEVEGVPNRSHILFHKGNKVEDTEGCILVAEEFGHLGNAKVAVLQSGKGFAEFMNVLIGLSEFTIHVKEGQ